MSVGDPNPFVEPATDEPTSAHHKPAEIVIRVRVRTLALLLLTISATFVFVCGGFFVWLAYDTTYDAQMTAAMQENEVVRKHIGVDLEAVYDEEESLLLWGMTEYCYQVTGPRGSGAIYADFVTLDEFTEVIGYGMLRLDSGEAYDLNSGEEIRETQVPVVMSVLRNEALDSTPPGILESAGDIK